MNRPKMKPKQKSSWELEKEAQHQEYLLRIGKEKVKRNRKKRRR